MKNLTETKMRTVNFERINFKDMQLLNFPRATSSAEILFIGENKSLINNDFSEIYHSIHFNDVASATTWLKSHKASIKIIIANTEIDGSNSIDAINTFKKEQGFIRANLIFLTNKICQKEMEKAVKAGTDDYFSSGIDSKDLLQRVDFLLKLEELKNSTHIEPKEIDIDTNRDWLKRGIDIFVSLTSLILLSPILLLVTVAIKLDSKGSIFYTSKRAGKGYEIFDFYKFRTMKQNADAYVKDMKHMNQYNNNSSDSVFFKIKDDPRITSVGSFLRKTSLDEIPQLINVLKGDMSLVGNRPLPLYEAEKLTQDQWAMRFLAPAGITGLWQVSKRGKEDMSEEERVSLDMEYAKKNSFMYDMKIMLKTPSALIQKEAV